MTEPAPHADLDLLPEWIHGARTPQADTDPPLQVHHVAPHTVILRQAKRVSGEAPFLYLLLGHDRALLLDTGDVADPSVCPVRQAVDAVLEGWLAQNPRAAGSPAYELIVAHTHGHRDHVRGDPQFADRRHTTVVDRELGAVQAFFGFTGWPAEVVTLDLGARVLEVVGIPGHHAASIGVHDLWTGLLLTGDTVYPGRLYVEDMPAFVDSLERLVALTETRPISAVLGCHLEMSRRPGRDFPLGARYQPDEVPLPMTVAQLVRLRDRARDVAGRPGVHRFDDVVIYNGRCLAGTLRLAAGGAIARLRRRFASRRG
jgi:glyoxylase-like metal-dependent hydrolase (beta-lactamase superfamily II)